MIPQQWLRRTVRVLLVLVIFAVAAPAAWRTWRSERDWADLQSNRVLRVGVDPSAQPLSFLMADGWAGFESDLAHALAHEMDLDMSVALVGYDGRYDALRVGQVDVFISAASPEGGQPDFAWSDLYLDVGTRLIVSQSAPIASAADLVGQRLAVARGGAADRTARYWQRRVAALDRVAVADDAAAIEELRSGRAAAALASGDFALSMGCPAHGNGSAAGRWRCIAIAPVPYAVLMRAEDQRLRREVNAALARLASSELPARWQTRWFPPSAR